MASEETSDATNNAAPGPCLRCNGEMVEGWIADLSQGVGREWWMTGVFIKNFWGAKLPPAEQRLPVTTYRCVRCGYLESYAV